MKDPERPFVASKASLIGSRGCNQDRCMILSNATSTLMVLADGLGGHPRGEIAAQIMVDVCETLFRHAPKPIPDPEHFMLQCIGKAHQAILRFGQRQEPPIAPRTTAVLAMIQSGTAHWVHVGDSRLYLVRDGEIHRQTRDHTQIRFVRQSQEQASRARTSLTRCLGGVQEPPTTTCSSPTPLQQGDTLVLCSDGLWAQIPRGALAAAFADPQHDIADCLNGLIEVALAKPNSDNVTGVALRWLLPSNTSDDGLSPDDPQLKQAIRHLESVLKENQEPSQ